MDRLHESPTDQADADTGAEHNARPLKLRKFGFVFGQSQFDIAVTPEGQPQGEDEKSAAGEGEEPGEASADKGHCASGRRGRMLRIESQISGGDKSNEQGGQEYFFVNPGLGVSLQG